MLHCVCRGPKESVETLKWLLEVMPHLKNQEILMMKNVCKHKGTGHFTKFCSCMYMYMGAILFLPHMAHGAHYLPFSSF